MKKEIEIEFGNTFSVKNYPGREDVVINVGPENKHFFHSARLFQAADGDIILRPGSAGTAGPENIERITGCLSLEEILEANRRGYEDQGMPVHFSERSEKILKRNSLLSPKRITIDVSDDEQIT